MVMIAVDSEVRLGAGEGQQELAVSQFSQL
jgi:hypothetical protein